MDVGMFQTPFVRPERTAKQVFDWAIRQAVHADKIGFSEYWVGEHATLNWESIPSPELVIAAAASQTKRIKLGPLAHLLPYHHPATLAIQTAWLSQILEGRYMLGVATGAYPTDAALAWRDRHEQEPCDDAGIHSHLMEKVWHAEPFQDEGDILEGGLSGAQPRETGPRCKTMGRQGRRWR